MTTLQANEVDLRRTFAIISHPDAGKTPSLKKYYFLVKLCKEPVP